MFAFDQYDLVIPHVVNIILGSVSCALVAKLVSFAGRKDIGLLSGCGLAVLPWHIAYSNLNTQEMLCGTILLLVVFSYTNKQWFWLAPLAFIGVLTRNEMTPILSVFGLYLIYRKDWKSAGAMLIGGVTGLTLWGFWCYSNTGNFFWWITERSLGSSWNHVFQMQQDRIAGNWYSPILSILQVFPYLIVVLINFKMIKKIKPALQHSVSKNVFTPLFFMLLFDWLFVFIMQFRFYPYPEPKYFMMTLPLACAVMGILISQSHEQLRLRVKKAMLFVGISGLILLSPTFYFLQYSGHASKTVGTYIMDNMPENGNIWMDYTVAWYYSGLPVSRLYSSYQLASRHVRYEPGFEDDLRLKMEQMNIRYVMSQPASYTYVFDIWPEMHQNLPFEWKGLSFVPLFTYTKPALSENPGISERIIDQVITNDTQAIFWEIKYSDPQNE